MQEPAITAVKTEEEVAVLCEMAARIWTEHYRPIIGEEQTAYMVEKYRAYRLCRHSYSTAIPTILSVKRECLRDTSALCKRRTGCF